jgi:hypothetical protein
MKDGWQIASSAQETPSLVQCRIKDLHARLQDQYRSGEDTRDSNNRKRNSSERITSRQVFQRLRYTWGDPRTQSYNISIVSKQRTWTNCSCHYASIRISLHNNQIQRVCQMINSHGSSRDRSRTQRHPLPLLQTQLSNLLYHFLKQGWLPLLHLNLLRVCHHPKLWRQQARTT